MNKTKPRKKVTKTIKQKQMTTIYMESHAAHINPGTTLNVSTETIGSTESIQWYKTLGSQKSSTILLP